MKFRARLHQYENEKLIAICDADLIGKSLRHNGVKITIQERFYGDLEYTVEEVLTELRTCSSFNVIGNEICQLLLDHEMVHPDTILKMGEEKIGHVIVVR